MSTPSTPENCAFCDPARQEPRIIRCEPLFMSFVSRPWFREGHCLVIPRRHTETLQELRPEESAAIMGELGRLASLLDNGLGYGTMHKYQPLQAENGIKMNHWHQHVFPRLGQEAGLFPVPKPNSFEAFSFADIAEQAATAEALR